MKFLLVEGLQKNMIEKVPANIADQMINDIIEYINLIGKDAKIIFVTSSIEGDASLLDDRIRTMIHHTNYHRHQWYKIINDLKSYYPSRISELKDIVHDSLPKDETIEFEVCGLFADTNVLKDMIVIEIAHPGAKITCLEDLTWGTSRARTLSALEVMDSMGFTTKDSEIAISRRNNDDEDE